MNRRPRPLWLMVLFAAAAAVAAPSTRDGVRQTAPWERYLVLSERNIFSRDRNKRPASRPASTQPRVVITTNEYFVLTGIGHDGREGIAFIEDTRSGRTIRARVGETVGEGRLVKITLDYVQYESKTKTTRIEIGSNLAGSIASRPSTTTASTRPAATVDAGAPQGATNADTSAILKRMRQRRERETGK